jgi:hypothetical protein
MARYTTACAEQGVPADEGVGERFFELGRSPARAARLAAELAELPDHVREQARRQIEQDWDREAEAERRDDDDRSYEHKLAELQKADDLREAALAAE